MEKQLRISLAACGASGQPVSVPLLRKGLARKPRRCSGGYEGSGLRPVADGGMEIGQRWTSFAYLCQKSPQRTTFSLEKSPAPSSNQIAAPVLQGWYDKEQRNGRPTCCLKLKCLSGHLLRENVSRALSHRGDEAGPRWNPLHSSYSRGIPRSADLSKDRATKETRSVVERANLPRCEGALR